MPTPKKIVLLADGTGNSDASPHKTNVWRLYQTLDCSNPQRQVAFYDNGVGTTSFGPSALLGLAFGFGLANNVRQLYLRLCRVYEPGDEVYCFGFSRGAFTARLLTSLITSEGIIDREKVSSDQELQRMVRRVYHRHRRTAFDPSLLSWWMRPLRDLWLNTVDRLRGRPAYNRELHARPAESRRVKFIGVWDTVDAYGFPIDEMQRAWDRIIWPLTAKDRNLSPNVERAAHALALDEQRLSFEPMLWNEDRDDEKRINQVWFPGVHANVGGGYPDDQLALNSLKWMLQEAGGDDGLIFEPLTCRNYLNGASALGPIYENRNGVGVLYRYSPRRLQTLCNETRQGIANRLQARRDKSLKRLNQVQVLLPKIHRSVFDRIKAGSDAYAPLGLPERFAVVEYNGELTNPTRELEPMDAAEQRYALQPYLWSMVDRRKAVYVGIVLTIGAFLVYPNGSPSQAFENWFEIAFGSLGSTLQKLPASLGEFSGIDAVASWAANYSAYPFAFTVFLLVIVGLIAASKRINRKLQSDARQSLAYLASQQTPPAEFIERTQRHSLLSSALDAWQQFSKRVVPRLTEFVAGATMVYLLIAMTGQTIFTLREAAGGMCAQNLYDQQADTATADNRLHAADVCHQLPYFAKQGTTYRVTFKGTGLRDSHIEADAQGLVETPYWMALALPIRRHVFADWFEPVLKIGSTRLDRYPLHSMANPIQTSLAARQAKADRPATRATQPIQQVSAEFTANQSGPVFVYLNDVFVPFPGLRDLLYKNNDGTLEVSICELESCSKPEGVL